jgi:hypothetical protein
MLQWTYYYPCYWWDSDESEDKNDKHVGNGVDRNPLS